MDSKKYRELIKAGRSFLSSEYGEAGHLCYYPKWSERKPAIFLKEAEETRMTRIYYRVREEDHWYHVPPRDILQATYKPKNLMAWFCLCKWAWMLHHSKREITELMEQEEHTNTLPRYYNARAVLYTFYIPTVLTGNNSEQARTMAAAKLHKSCSPNTLNKHEYSLVLSRMLYTEEEEEYKQKMQTAGDKLLAEYDEFVLANELFNI